MFILTAAVILVLLVFIFLNRKNSAVGAIVAQYKQLLQEHVAFYRQLDKSRQDEFLRKVILFSEQVHIEGVGTTISELDRVLVAASAIIPVFGFEAWRYPNLTNIILYPDTFNTEFQFEGSNRNILGMVGTGYMNGQMLLSKSALHQGFSAAAGKSNTAIHEFVHLLDQSDGSTDGMPEILLEHQYAIPWLKLIHQEMRRIRQGHSDIDSYALTSEAEFFAVAAEYFFEKPEQFKSKHPELFTMLDRMFNPKPAL